MPDADTTLSLAGLALLEQRQFADAKTFLRLYLDLATAKHPEGWRRFDAVSALGGALLGQMKYAEAEPLLREGYSGLKKYEARIPASFRQARLTAALARLIQLCDETNQPDEAAKWRRALEATRSP